MSYLVCTSCPLCPRCPTENCPQNGRNCHNSPSRRRPRDPPLPPPPCERGQPGAWREAGRESEIFLSLGDTRQFKCVHLHPDRVRVKLQPAGQWGARESETCDITIIIQLDTLHLIIIPVTCHSGCGGRLLSCFRNEGHSLCEKI